MLAFTSVTSNAQAPTIEWAKCFGGNSSDEGIQVLQTADGGYLVGGHSNSTVGGNIAVPHPNDIAILKLDSSGNIEWQHTYGGTWGEYLADIKSTPDGGYVFVASTASSDGNVTFNHGNYDFWVVKLDASGNIQWEKTYGGTKADEAKSISLTSDGGYIICGQTLSNDGDVTGFHGTVAHDVWVIKIDSLGNLIWNKSLGGSSTDHGKCIIQVADGGYILAGNTKSLDGQVSQHIGMSVCAMDYWVIKLSPLGEIEWDKCIAASVGSPDLGSSYAEDIIQTSDGGFLLSGYGNANYGYSPEQGMFGYQIVKLTATGGITWQKKFGGFENDQPSKAIETVDGNFVIAGFSRSTNGYITTHHGNFSNDDLWILKIDTAGGIMWQQCYGGSDSEQAQDIVQTLDGGFITIGYSRSNDHDVTGHFTSSDYWVIKLSPESLGVHEGTSVSDKIYPNPTTEMVHFNLAEAVDHVIVYDTNGKSVMEIKQYNIDKIDIRALRQGVYFIKAKSGKNSFTQKIIKLQ